MEVLSVAALANLVPSRCYGTTTPITEWPVWLELMGVVMKQHLEDRHHAGYPGFISRLTIYSRAGPNMALQVYRFLEHGFVPWVFLPCWNVPLNSNNVCCLSGWRLERSRVKKLICCTKVAFAFVGPPMFASGLTHQWHVALRRECSPGLINVL